MGQHALGILYGCEVPPGYDSPEPGGENRIWEAADQFNAKAKRGYDKQRVRVESEGDRMLVGVWVAVGGSGEDGTPFLGEKCILLTDLAESPETIYGKSIGTAKKLWERFARGQPLLPDAQLWLIPCEVA